MTVLQREPAEAVGSSDIGLQGEGVLLSLVVVLRRPRWLSVSVVAVVLVAAGCSDDQRESSTVRDGVPEEVIVEESPPLCDDLAVNEVLARIPELLRGGLSGEPVDATTALAALREAEGLERSAGAAAALEDWANDPTDLDRLDAVAERFGELDEEIAARC